MRPIRRKLRSDSGLTLVESLCAVLVLSLLGLMVITGMGMASKSYRQLTAQSETRLLLSTLADVLADDLRYARAVTTREEDGKAKLDTYLSDSYGEKTAITVGADGQLRAGNGTKQNRVLPDGAYGKGAYVVKELEITYNETAGTFTLILEVKESRGETGARAELTIRRLNEDKEDIMP